MVEADDFAGVELPLMYGFGVSGYAEISSETRENAKIQMVGRLTVGSLEHFVLPSFSSGKTTGKGVSPASTTSKACLVTKGIEHIRAVMKKVFTRLLPCF